MKTSNTKRLTVSAVMLALATVLALVCAFLPLRLPMGGSFTVASMLPIVIVSYMYGVKWGIFTSLTYAAIQIVMDLCTGVSGSTIMALFMPNSDMGILAAVSILLIDYIIAYSVLGLGGLFRNTVKNKAVSLCLGSILALSLRYLAHIVSGAIFYGQYAKEYLTDETAWYLDFGLWIVEHFSGGMLAIVYSVLYNGLYMIPEIIITAIAAVAVSPIRPLKKQ